MNEYLLIGTLARAHPRVQRLIRRLALMTPGAGVRLLACVICLGLTSIARPTIRAQETTFRAGADLVQLDVVVLDRNRRPVTGLVASDFTIIEEGKPREIEAFVPVSLPSHVVATSAAWMRGIAPDVVTNTYATDGRVVVIMLDRSIPSGKATGVARKIAHAAVDALGPGDLATVVNNSPFRGDGMPQSLTSDRARLRHAIDAEFKGATPDPSATGAGDIPVPSGGCTCGVCSLAAIEWVADQLAAMTGRHKMLLFIGSEIAINDWSLEIQRYAKFCIGSADQPRDRTLRALGRANVMLHAFDPRGLETLANGAEPDVGGRRLSVQQHLIRQGDLSVFPDYTGGRAVVNAAAPELVVPEIFAETQSYYLLGFQHTPVVPGNERRSIRVRVNRDDVEVRSRTEYFAPTFESAALAPPAPSAESLTGLLPKTDLPLSLGLTPRFRPDGLAEVAVLIGVTDGGRDVDRRFDVTVAVFDHRARLIGSEQQTVDVPAVLASRQTVESHSSLLLLPGRYEVRIGVVDAATNEAGSVYGYIEVPDLRGAPLALSGILVEAHEDLGTHVGSGDTPSAPTVRRRFGDFEVVTASVQVLRQPPFSSPVSLRARVTDANDHVVVELSREIDASLFTDSAVAEVRFEVPMATMEPGRYLLTVEAARGELRQRRDLQFEVQ